MTTSTAARAIFAPPRVIRRPSGDGGFVLQSAAPLQPYEDSLGLLLRRWAAEAPDRTFLAERDGAGGWREVSYAAAQRSADAIAQALLDRGLSQDRPVMVLSGNSIEHALLMLGAYLAGVPIAPISPAYSTPGGDFGKVRHAAKLIRPGLVFVQDADALHAALAVDELRGTEVVTAGGGPGTPFDDLLATPATGRVEAALRAIPPEAVAKILFTSGSTDLPKGVPQTHRMLCSNQQAMAQCWPFLTETPPVLVDWLPWNHTFGGNHDFNLVLKHGGTLYLDAGKPAPALVGRTIENLREVSQTVAFNVPVGFGLLLPHLEQDAELRARFFARLQLIFYAAAALPQDLWDRLEAVAVKERGEPVPMTSSWGLTETAPAATTAHYPIPRAGIIGVPVPGCEVKLVPEDGKHELRVRGPNVFPGYLGRPDLTEASFDAEGFYRTGDAGKLADPDDLDKGLVFDGRIVEDFKLSSGTFVSVGRLRVAALAAADGLLQDAVVCGHDRDEVCLLAWPAPGGPPPEELLAEVAERLRAHNATQTGSSTRVARIALLAEPPSMDHNEITDKGYVNQRAVLARRAADVERLYAQPSGPGVASCR
jgi:feruloyl-CoA synthase